MEDFGRSWKDARKKRGRGERKALGGCEAPSNASYEKSNTRDVFIASVPRRRGLGAGGGGAQGGASFKYLCFGRRRAARRETRGAS